MLYYLYGTESYLIRKKFEELIGADKPIKFDLSRDIDSNQVGASLSSGGLFGNPPVVFTNPSKFTGEFDFESILRPKDEQVVIFYEYEEPKKTNKLVKLLLKIAKCEGCEKPKPAQFRAWLSERLKKSGGKLTYEQIEQIYNVTGGNLGQANQIIEKIELYNLGKSNWQIDNNLLDDLAGFDTAGTIFNLTDAISSGETKKAFTLLHKLLSGGENEIYILVMITSQYRRLILVRDMLDQGLSNLAISKEAGVPFFVIDRTVSMAKRYSMDKLKKIYGKLFDAEISIKTGRMTPKVLLDLLVLALAK